MKIIKKAARRVDISLVALSGALTAQAAEENENKGPEFYRMLYVSMALQEPEDTRDLANNEPSHWAFNSRISRVGIKQDIALNDKLTAVYKIETGVEIDDGERDRDGKSFYQRDIYLGVKGDYGQIIGGCLNTPMSMTEG